MGNEMGNNNTSGFQEGDSTTAENQGKSSQQAVPGIDVTAESHVVPQPRDKDYHEKGARLAADDPKPAEADRTLYGNESSKAERKTDEGCGDNNESHSDSLSNELEGHDNPTHESLEENLLGNSHAPIEKLASLKEEEVKEESNPSSVSIPTSHDREPQDFTESEFHQLEFAAVHCDQPNNSTCSPGETGNLQGSIIICNSKENGHHGHECETNIDDSLDGIVVSETNLDTENKMDEFLVKEMKTIKDMTLRKETYEAESGESGPTPASDFQSDVGKECDGVINSEMNDCGDNTSEPQSESNLMVNSLNSHDEAIIPEDKFMVTEETDLKRKESESEDSQQDYVLSQCIEDTSGEAEAKGSTQMDSLVRPDCVINENEGSVYVSPDPEGNADCQVETNNDDQFHSIEIFNYNQCEDHEEHCNKSTGETEMVLEHGKLPTELSISDARNNEEDQSDYEPGERDPAEKQIVEEIKEKPEGSCSTWKVAEEIENGEQEMFRSVPMQEYKPDTLTYLSQSPDQQNTVMESEDAQGSAQPSLQFKPENFGEFFITNASSSPDSNFTVEATTSPVELEDHKCPSEASYYAKAASDKVTETKSSASAKQNAGKCEQVGPSVFDRGGFEGQESMGRLRTEPIPDDLKVRVQMRKCPSFDFGLRIEARTLESDQTPLLYQDKTTIESFSNQTNASLGIPLVHDQCHGEALQYEAMPMEEKVITLERNDSEKSRTPFLGFMKEDEEAHEGVNPREQRNHGATKKATKEVASNLPESKEKHKRRTSLFSNCICCTTVIN